MTAKKRSPKQDWPIIQGFPKPWEKQPGETNLWYNRFYTFCKYGTSRSLSKCYREIMAQKKGGQYIHALGTAPAAPKPTHVPGAWVRQVNQFDWWGRSQAWDQRQQELAADQVDETVKLLQQHSLAAAQYLIDLMNGDVKDADGNKPSNLELQQRRLAANNILDRVGVIVGGLRKEPEEDQDVEVIGIVINRAESRSDQEQEELAQITSKAGRSKTHMDSSP